MIRSARMFLLLGALLSVGCSSDTNSKGLRAGTYRVQFDIPVTSTVPGGLIGHHDFTFTVVAPITSTNFTLLTSTLSAKASYLDAAKNGVVASTDEWRLQWKYPDTSTLGVRVTMHEDGAGGWTLPFGCNGFRNEVELFPGTSCTVTRVQ